MIILVSDFLLHSELSYHFLSDDSKHSDNAGVSFLKELLEFVVVGEVHVGVYNISIRWKLSWKKIYFR